MPSSNAPVSPGCGPSCCATSTGLGQTSMAALIIASAVSRSVVLCGGEFSRQLIGQDDEFGR